MARDKKSLIENKARVIIFIIYITIISILVYFIFNITQYKPITAWFLGVAHAVIGFLGILNTKT